MNKALIVTTAVVVGVVAAGAGSMMLVDGQIDNAVSQFESQSNDLMTIDIVSDNSGFLDRQLTLKIGMDLEGESVNIILKNDIQKRPWGTSIEHALTLDPSFISAVNDPKAAEFLSTNFINSPMLAGNTNLTMFGSYQTNLASFSINEPLEGFEVIFTPWLVNVKGSVKGDMLLNSNWNGMKLVSTYNELQAFDLNWKPMTMVADGNYHGGNTFIGKQSITGQGMSLITETEYESVNVQMGDFALASNSDVEKGRYNGDIRWDTSNLTFDVDGSVFTVTDIVLAANMSGFDVDNLSELSQELNAMSSTGGLDLSPSLIRTGNKALQDGFSFGLTEVSAKVDGKEAKMSFEASLPANKVADIGNVFSLMGLIPTVFAQADLKIHKDIAEMPELSEQIFSLMMMGALIEENDGYVLSARFENGAATLNGQPVPLPF